MAPHGIPPPPPDEEGIRLHRSLLSPGAAATADFAFAYLPHLDAWLRSGNPGAGADLCEEAALEAVYGLMRDPSRFQPGKGKGLLGYLRMSAQGDLKNLLRREARHAHQPLDENCVELGRAAGNEKGEDGDPLLVLCDREDEQERRAFLGALRDSLPEPDRSVLDLMLAGERDYAKYAEALGVGRLPREKRDAEVKRAKDRIQARIKRTKEGA